jgi:glycosyltransferase involved in cell wall biosynthesis
MKKISVIIPFLNEAENIPFLVDELSGFCTQNQLVAWEIIFVNDGSTDASVEILSASKFKGFEARIISFSKNFGSHAALRAGIVHASGDLISFMYADLQDPLSLLLEMYAEYSSGKYNIIWATRKSLPTGFVDRNFSKGYSKLMQKYAIPTYPNNGFDIVMFDQKIQNSLNQNIEPNSSIFLQILTLGFSQTTVFYNKLERKAGKSKWTVSKKIKLLIDSFVAFSFFPIRLVTLVGVAFFVLGVIFSVYLIFRKLFIGDLTQGWPMLGSILMLGFGLTNISLGIIAEYLWRTLDSSRKRPVFIIDEIININKYE